MAAKKKRKPHGICCLEGDWDGDFNQSSTVKPVMKLLAQGLAKSVPFLHRDAATKEELQHYLSRWSKSAAFRKFDILYLAFHGDPNVIYLGTGKAAPIVTLDELGEQLEGALTGRIVHFGTCSTLKTDERNLQRFLRRTNASAVSGFMNSVDWLYSAVFEVLLFEIMMRYSLDRNGARRIRDRVKAEAGPMSKALQFRMVVRKAS